ncbi:MAG: nitroreductase family protein [Eubacteriales bacterium]
MKPKNIFTQRRAIRYFDSKKNLPSKRLEEIIDLAVLAPSAFNLQPWDIIAVRSKNAKQLLSSLSGEQQKILDAPVTLILVGNREGYAIENPVWEEARARFKSAAGYDAAVQTAQSLYGASPERKTKFAESNVGLLAMSIMYAASFLGVASHPMSAIDFDGVKKAFGIAEGKSVVMLIALGYEDTKKALASRRPRRRYADIVTEV